MTGLARSLECRRRMREEKEEEEEEEEEEWGEVVTDGAASTLEARAAEPECW